MRRLILISLVAAVMAGSAVAQSRFQKTQDDDAMPNHRTNVAFQDVLSKFRSCSAGRAACAEACNAAVQSFQGAPEGDAGAIAHCNTAHAAGIERGSGRVLIHDTYAWVQDVEGIVVQARGFERRKGFKVVADGNVDWINNCGSQAKTNSQVGLEAREKLVPGVRVRLTYVQHDTTKTPANAPGGKCQFGGFEVIG